MRLTAIVLAFLLQVTSAGAADLLDCRLVAGWQQTGAERSYDGETLFEYMNGNAEGYRVYGFVLMQGITCESNGDAIIMDVSEMTNPDAAYGIYAASRHPSHPDIRMGMGGQVLPRRATFAKGKYYVELAANPDKDHSAALQAFATEIEKRIPGRSTPPETVSWFPEDKLISARLIPQSVLGLSALRRGYVAEYEEGKAFIVAEDSPESASALLEKLRGRFGETTRVQVGNEAFQANDRYLGGICIFRKGRYIGGYANLPEAAVASNLAQTLVSRIP